MHRLRAKKTLLSHVDFYSSLLVVVAHGGAEAPVSAAHLLLLLPFYHGFTHGRNLVCLGCPFFVSTALAPRRASLRSLRHFDLLARGAERPRITCLSLLLLVGLGCICGSLVLVRRPGVAFLMRHVDVRRLLLQLHLFRDCVLHVHASRPDART